MKQPITLEEQVDQEGECLGYGEITKQGVERMIELINEGLFSDSSFKAPIEFDQSPYRLDTSSLFMDIGAGSGKVVMHVDLRIQCLSIGIEVCEHRVKVSRRFKARLLIHAGAPLSWSKLVELHHVNALSFSSYQHNGKDVSHIYMFDKVFNDDLLEGIVHRLNNISFQVLVSSQSPSRLEKFGLTRVVAAASFKASMGRSKYKMFIYVKLPTNDA